MAPDRDRDRDREPHRSDDPRRQRRPQSGMEPPTFHGSDSSDAVRRGSDSRASFAPSKHPQLHSSGDGDRRGLSVDTSRRALGGPNDGRSMEASPRDVTMHDVGGGGGTGHPWPPDRANWTNASPAVRSPPTSRTPSDAVAIRDPSPATSAYSSAPRKIAAVTPAVGRAESFSEVVARVSDVHARYQAAQKKLELARIERNSRREHFDTFASIRERYQGAYDKAEEECRKYKEEWSYVSIWADTYFKSPQLENDGEDITSRKIQKDLGSPPIDIYIEKVVQEKLALANLPGIAELQTQVQTLQSNDQQRTTELVEFKKALAKIDTTCKSMESKQTFLNGQVEEMRKSIEPLKKEVTDAQQLAVMATDSMQKLNKIITRVEEFEGDLKKAASTFAEVRSELAEHTSQQEALRQRLDAPIPVPTSTNMGISREELRKEIDDVVEPIKKYVDESLDGLGDVGDKCARDIHKTQADIAKLVAELEGLTSNTMAEVLKLRNEYTGGLMKAGEDMQALLGASGREIQAVKDLLVREGKRIEGLDVAIRHCDDRLSLWSTNDYYEKVANLLVARIPNWFNTAQQVQHLTNNDEIHRTQLQKLAGQLQAINAQLQNFSTQANRLSQSPGAASGMFTLGPARNPFTDSAAVSNDANGSIGGSNGANGSILGSNGANGPPPIDFEQIKRDLEELKEKLQKLEESSEALSQETLPELKHETNGFMRQTIDRLRNVYNWSEDVNSNMVYHKALLDSLREQTDAQRAYLRDRLSGSPGIPGTPEMHAAPEHQLRPLAQEDDGMGLAENGCDSMVEDGDVERGGGG